MIKFNEVTWYSKLAAIIFFIGVFPALCFYIGNRYGEVKSLTNIQYSEGLVSAKKNTNNKLETASNLKTYHSEKYGFEFKYPEMWGDPFINTSIRKIDCNSDDTTVGIEYSISVLSVGLACENYRFETSDLVDTIPRKVMVGGKESLIYEYTSATNYTNKEIFIPKFDGIYIYLLHSYKNTPDNTPLTSSELDTILSTFKFIK